jgi:quercetin dioxygenase-like cupin family protein
MEPYPGVFVSTVRTEEWEPDPEVPGSEMHELVHADGVWASPWTPSQRETIHVLQGEVAIEIAGGPTLMLKPGDLASLPAGLETIWHITPPFRELWVLA